MGLVQRTSTGTIGCLQDFCCVKVASRQSQPRYHHHLNFHYAFIQSILNTVFTKIKL